MIPNVLLAYAFDEKKLRAFTDTYNDLMLGDSGLSKLEREMIAVVVSSVNHCYYCLTAHGAAVRQLSGDPALGEMMVMNFRAADLTPQAEGHAGFRGQADRDAGQDRGEPTAPPCAPAGFSDRDIWDIASTAAFFNMSNRVAAAVDMRPNPEYHAMARGVEQVNTAMVSVSQAAKETEASASQTLATASQLAGLSKDLNRLVQSGAASS